MIIGLGTMTSIFYIITMKEVFLTNEAKKYEKEFTNENKIDVVIEEMPSLQPKQS